MIIKNKLMIIIKIISLCLLLCFSLTTFWYYIYRVKVDVDFCRQQLAKTDINKDFFDFIDQQAINATNPLLWETIEHRDEIFQFSITQKMRKDPVTYLGDVLKVISSSKYDENQKMSAIFPMKYLSVKHYLCVMDTTNKAYEQGIINKRLLQEVISPDPYYGIISYFWWLPDWQERFKKHADQLYSQEYIQFILTGGQFELFPLKA
ncbi:hypothetical protein BHC44_02100 [Snodgrassella alvi]|jgi:hypothetical protein|nr:hypothetical protein BHC44_02100 [Snodgrassella alvi]